MRLDFLFVVLVRAALLPRWRHHHALALSGTLNHQAVFYRLHLLDAAGYFHSPVDTLLGINDAAQRHVAVCGSHV